MDTASADLVELAGNIVSAYVANNSVKSGDVAALIASVHTALAALGKPQAPEPEKLTPPVSIRRSLTPDFLISLEDGRQYKSLKRHLAGRGLTPAEYRAKWGLPSDYPMVAPNYAKQRSELARSLGLGQKRNATAAKKSAAKKAPRKAAKG